MINVWISSVLVVQVVSQNRPPPLYTDLPKYHQFPAQPSPHNPLKKFPQNPSINHKISKPKFPHPNYPQHPSPPSIFFLLYIPNFQNMLQPIRTDGRAGYGARLRFLHLTTISWSRKWRGFESHSVHFFLPVTYCFFRQNLV